MDEYPNLKRYFDDYIANKGVAEHEGCYPNLIIWVREALGEQGHMIVDYLEMPDFEVDEFWSWGHNSRWRHVVQPYFYEYLVEGTIDQRNAMAEMLEDIAGIYGDPDIEQKYFSKKDKQDG